MHPNAQYLVDIYEDKARLADLPIDGVSLWRAAQVPVVYNRITLWRKSWRKKLMRENEGK